MLTPKPLILFYKTTPRGTRVYGVVIVFARRVRITPDARSDMPASHDRPVTTLLEFPHK
jgi:hypothetical protein